jgi:prepilin-type N-terminal cleavage/methylation domain-containing protein
MRLTPAWPPRGPRDAGFTLTELLVAIIILGLVTASLAAALIGWMRNSDDTYDRLVLSHDAQLSAAYFARDVASLGIRDYAVSGMPFKQSISENVPVTCGSTTIPSVLVRLLSDRWGEVPDGPDPDTDPDWTSGEDVVAYYLESPTGITRLHRLRCSGTTVDDTVVAHNVRTEDEFGNKLTSLSCSPTCAAAAPDEVTLKLTVTRPSGDDYKITLTGQRRQT